MGPEELEPLSLRSCVPPAAGAGYSEPLEGDY